MKLLKERMLADGKVLPGGVIKIDSFLNRTVDTALARELALEWKRRFNGERITKVLTVEASGIAIAAIVALELGVPMVFARKARSVAASPDTLVSKVVSYTHGNTYCVSVDREHISDTDRVLIIDDFLANGSALSALVDICRAANAEVVGAGVAVEKAYLRGGERIRNAGVRVESLARLGAALDNGKIEFV